MSNEESFSPLVPFQGQKRKVNIDHLAPGPCALPGFSTQLPDVLGARDLKAVVMAIVEAEKRHKPVILAMGAHPIKLGLSPVIRTLFREGILTHLATNGASIVHDVEWALFGATSEDVEEGLITGQFGVTQEVLEFIHGAISPCEPRWGLGRAIGDALLQAAELREGPVRFPDLSLFAETMALHRPPTVHVTIGADVTFLYPFTDGGLIGEASHADFHRLIAVLADLHDGGVLLHMGSAVTMPEVILKGVAWLRARGVSFEGAVTANFDMIRHYRPQTQIIDRMTTLGATGYHITGQHEIMLPLLAGLVLAARSEAGPPQPPRELIVEERALTLLDQVLLLLDREGLTPKDRKMLAQIAIETAHLREGKEV